MSQLLKGAPVGEEITSKVLKQSLALKEVGIVPTLAILRVGEDPSDLAYERGALKRAEKCGVEVERHLLPFEATTEDVVNKLKELNEDKKVHGILLFRPLPKHIDDEVIRNSIATAKDVDGISDISMAGLYGDKEASFAPCTARACVELLKHYDIKIQGKRVVVLGRSLVIGKPVSMLLLKENATVTLCHSKSQDLDKIVKDAHIVIVAVGRINAMGYSMANEDQIVIDVGINIDQEGKLKGDADFDKLVDIVKGITPVPGGVGSVTTSVLMDHVVRAAKRLIGN